MYLNYVSKQAVLSLENQFTYNKLYCKDQISATEISGCYN